MDLATRLAQRETELARRLQALTARQAEIGRTLSEVRELEAALAQANAARRQALETHSGVSSSVVVAELRDAWVDEARRQAERRTHLAMIAAEQSATNRARHALGVVLERYRGVGHLERVQNKVVMQAPQVLAALTAGEVAQAFGEATGCELTCDAEAAVVVSSDPLARAVGRRVLQQMATWTSAASDKVRNLASAVREEIDEDVLGAGTHAVSVLELTPLHPEILQLVGRLKYRLSYSQNQWRHAIEVGFLAGLLAAELGADVQQARRGGLLHDIGKAMTHDHEGGHAVLGAEVARRCSEDEVVANAIGAHHDDEPVQSAVAHIVTAADALSGGRPGARRESVTQYLKRLAQIQSIAYRSQVVQQVDVMHGGREVRVVVDEKSSLQDADLHPLARQIASSIEEEVIYAGQIRVTVIRESRSVAVAT